MAPTLFARLIATMTYTFGRVSAVVRMRVGDYYPNGKRWWVRLHEKGGRDHELPAHHKLEEWLDAYLDASGIAGEKRRLLFATLDRAQGGLSERPLDRRYVWRMLRKRAAETGIDTPIGPHTLRATGITNYITNGGSLAEAWKVGVCGEPEERIAQPNHPPASASMLFADSAAGVSGRSSISRRNRSRPIRRVEDLLERR